MFACEVTDILSEVCMKEKKTEQIINSIVKRLELETMERGGGKCDLSGPSVYTASTGRVQKDDTLLKEFQNQSFRIFRFRNLGA